MNVNSALKCIAFATANDQNYVSREPQTLTPNIGPVPSRRWNSESAKGNHMAKLPKDPSAVVVHDGMVHLVGNESDQRYFRFTVEALPKTGEAKRLSDLELIDTVEVDHTRANDLESIDVLEGRIAVISEDVSQIICRDKTVVDYSDIPSLRENGGRGLEGMSIRELAGKSSQVAVVWEGGIHHSDDSIAGLPLLMTHCLPRGCHGSKVVFHGEIWEERLCKVKMPSAFKDKLFRCPDLVWCWSTADEQWGLLLLLSQQAPRNSRKKYLQLYDPSGTPLGEPAHLEDLGLPSEGDYIEHNWEGLCWHTDENGNDSLLMVNDAQKKSKKFIARIRPPQCCLRHKKTKGEVAKMATS
ncbi:MAG: hypothetical protein ACI9G1_005806 [Pirellulaceae bacterium]